MKLRFLYATLLLAIVTVKAEGDVVGAGNEVGNNDLGIIVERDDPGNRGRSINDAEDHSGNEILTRILENNNFDENQGNVNDSSKPPDTPSSATNSSIPSTDPSDTSTTSSTSSTESSNTSTNSSISSSDSPNPSTNSSTPEPNLPNQEDYPYQVKGQNGTACILSKMTISLSVKYNNTNNETIDGKPLTIPDNATVTGKCNDKISDMVLTWPSEVASNYVDESINFADSENSIKFDFKKNDSKFWIEKITGKIYLDGKNFPNKSDDFPNPVVLNLVKNLFETDTGSKYVCNVEAVVQQSDTINLTMTVQSLIAFNDNNDVSSKSESKCAGYIEPSGESTESADVGAIVGGIIGALAVIGIIGFVIWRRRRNNSPVRSEVA